MLRRLLCEFRRKTRSQFAPGVSLPVSVDTPLRLREGPPLVSSEFVGLGLIGGQCHICPPFLEAAHSQALSLVMDSELLPCVGVLVTRINALLQHLVRTPLLPARIFVKPPTIVSTFLRHSLVWGQRHICPPFLEALHRLALGQVVELELLPRIGVLVTRINSFLQHLARTPLLPARTFAWPPTIVSTFLRHSLVWGQCHVCPPFFEAARSQSPSQIVGLELLPSIGVPVTRIDALLKHLACAPLPPARTAAKPPTIVSTFLRHSLVWGQCHVCPPFFEAARSQSPSQIVGLELLPSIGVPVTRIDALLKHLACAPLLPARTAAKPPTVVRSFLRHHLAPASGIAHIPVVGFVLDPAFGPTRGPSVVFALAPAFGLSLSLALDTAQRVGILLNPLGRGAHVLPRESRPIPPAGLEPRDGRHAPLEGGVQRVRALGAPDKAAAFAFTERVAVFAHTNLCHAERIGPRNDPLFIPLGRLNPDALQRLALLHKAFGALPFFFAAASHSPLWR